LKRRRERGIAVGGEFPRLFSRGSIEALEAVAVLEGAPNFRGCSAAAPLKPAEE